MKTKNLLFVSAILLSGSLYAGGILTNTNQSAMFTRTQVRDATLDIDAVYFNPAGVVKLPDGIHLSLNNQTLGQTRTITSDYKYLNNKKYIGDVFAPIFPGIYAAYVKGPLAVSVGFNPIGGGGGGIYDDGLPSFEYAISDLVPGLKAQGQDVTGYKMDAYFEGSSIYFGTQVNLSYEINDMISVAIGGRIVNAKEAYNGYLKDINVTVGGNDILATTFFSGLSALASGGATQTGGVATNLKQLTDGGFTTFDQAVGAGLMTAVEKTNIEQGLKPYGGADLTGATLAQAQAAYAGASAQFSQKAAEAGAKAKLLDDQEVDYEKTATGITPIVSVNIKPNDKLNIAVKYEHATKLEFENSTTKDFMVGFKPDGDSITMFPNGEKSRLDLPTQIAIGGSYWVNDQLLVSGGLHYYLDKSADWNGRQDSLDGNMIELAIGGEYSLSEKLLVSGGYLFTKSGAVGRYQTDLSYSLPSSTIGIGAAYNINEMLQVNIGGSYTMYQEGDKTFKHDVAGSGTLLDIKEKFDKNVWVVAVGLNINISK